MPPKKLVYQLKITLKDSKPPIWRRIQVPASYTFWELHSAIQDAMGWTNSHLHEFRFHDRLSGVEKSFGIPCEEDFYDEIKILPGWKHKISKYLNLAFTKMMYVYDFGDNWEHVITLEEILPAEKDVAYPICLKGKRACPPEDCGGVLGYGDLLEVLADPKHEEHKDTKSWVESMKEGPFDPEHFDPTEVVFEYPQKRFKECFKED